MTTDRLKPRLATSFAWTMGGSVGVLVLNMTTGILTARLLTAGGRGELGAIHAWAITASMLGGLGFREAATLFVSRQPERGPRILGTTALVTAVLAVITIVVTVLLVPFGFRAQSPELVRLAQLFMLWVLPLMTFHTAISLLAGYQDHRTVTALRVGEPLLFAVSLMVLWQVDAVTLTSVLLAHSLSFVAVDVVAVVVLTRLDGWGRPDRELLQHGLSFGIRVHGRSLGDLVNTRLDLILLPAFVAVEDIGRYVVAVSAASVVVPLFGYLSIVLLPAAARLPRNEALEMSERVVRLVIMGSLVIALPLAVGAPWLLGLVYGPDFVGGAGPMRILVPGLVLWAAASITADALKATGRPGLTSISQLTALVFTVAGLFYALPRWGVIGAATVSSCAYALVFLIEVVALSRDQAFSGWRLLRFTRALDDVRYVLSVRSGDEDAT